MFVERKTERGAARSDWRAAPPATGVECAGVRQGRTGRAGGRTKKPEQRRRFPQGCGEEEAELGLVGAGTGVPSPGSRQRRRGPTRAHPTISRLAAGYPLGPRQQVGRTSRTSGTGRGACGGGFLQTRSSRDDSRGGRGGGGSVCGGSRQTDCSHPVLRKAATPEEQGSEKQLEIEESGRKSPASRCPAAVPRASSSPPHTRQRGVARGAAEALTPPAPSAAAAA